MKVTVDFDLCQGHAECEMEAPQWFTVGKGPGAKARAKPGEIPDEHLADVRNAVDFCPARALVLTDDD